MDGIGEAARTHGWGLWSGWSGDKVIHGEEASSRISGIICVLSGIGRQASCQGCDAQETDKPVFGRKVVESEEEQSKDFWKPLQ